MRFITLTLNPCLDVTMWSDGVTQTQSGGKGLNVARVLTKLGVNVLAIAPLGGQTGRNVATECANEGIPLLPVPIIGGTRRVITHVERDTYAQTVNFEPGPLLTDGECAAIIHAIKSAIQPGDVFALCGGASCESGALLAAETLRIAKGKGAFTLLDSNRAALKHGVTASPDVIKPNLVELGQLLNREITHENAAEAAREIMKSYAIEIALVTLGEHGALCVTRDHVNFCPAKPIKTINPVGSGDCFTAAWLFTRDLTYACAAGAANAAMFSAAMIGKDDIERILNECPLTLADCR